MMLLIGALVCIGLLGYLAQNIGLCMVRGVREWRDGDRMFLLAILCSGLLSWVAILLADYLDIAVKFKAYQVSGWFIAGGLLFGLGSAINHGCGVSTLGRLARGDSRMIATVLGWLVGWFILAHWQPHIERVKNPIAESMVAMVLMIASAVILLTLMFANGQRRKLWFSMMGIGLLAGFLFLYQSNWPPSGLLRQLSQALVAGDQAIWPTLDQYWLFMALLLGMFLAAWRAKTFQFIPSTLKHWLVHLNAGVLMGIGASLALGGNDAQLLLALPAFSPAGVSAVLSMIAGIWLGMWFKELGLSN